MYTLFRKSSVTLYFILLFSFISLQANEENNNSSMSPIIAYLLSDSEVDTPPTISDKDIAHSYGIATQGTDSSYAYYSPASNVIDNNTTTYNHTRGGSNGENWIQIELPNPTIVHRILLQSRSSNADRLEGAKVYITDTPYDSTLDTNTSLFTLLGTASEQNLSLDLPTSGKYLIIKGEDSASNSKHLHLIKVEVYGELPATPVLDKESYVLGLEFNSSIGTIVGEIQALDYQNDDLSYSLVGLAPFSIDTNGTLRLTEELNYNMTQSYTFSLSVSDGEHNISAEVTVNLLNGHGVQSQRWNDISGIAVSDLLTHIHYQDPADETRILSTFDFNENSKSNFGEVLTALLKLKESGDYIFAIVGDDGTQLNLNGDMIAYKTNWGSYQDWSQAGKSSIIHLEKGSVYPLQAFLKESGGGEHISVAWKKVEDTEFTVIPSDVLYLGFLDSQSVQPIVTLEETEYLISSTTALDTVLLTIEAIDLQGDTLVYTILDDVPFSIDENGQVTLDGILDSGSYTFDITVSDGVNIITVTLTINVTSATAIADVLASGDVINTLVTEEELIQATLDEINSLRNGDSLLSEIYEEGAIAYAPGNSKSQLINIFGDVKHIFPIIYGNKGKVLAVAGRKEASRFSIFASNPLYFFQKDENLAYQPYMKRVFSWLLEGEPIDMTALDENKSIVLSFVTNSSDIENWIATNYPQWSVKSCNDRNTLESCSLGSDMIIFGRSADDTDAEAIPSILTNMTTQGMPILYLHDNWDQNNFANAIASFFQFEFPYGGNFWEDESATWTDVTQMQLEIFEKLGYEPIETMFTHFQNKDYAFDWSVCKDGTDIGSQYDDCSDVVGLDSEFQVGASKVRTILNNLDTTKKDIFKENGYRLQELLALTSDKFRQSVIYPMDKVTTDDNTFMKSYYADHAVYNYRTINPIQPDMGNFSRSDFSQITPITKTVNLISKKNFRSTGVYALAGQTMKVTRNDSSNVTVKVFINTLRSQATHQYQQHTASDKGYTRPKYLETPYFTLETNETIELTSPYGGTVQLSFDTNDLPVEVTFENVGEHPYWASSADNASFAQKMSENQYDWAEIATAGFEVHSKIEKMVESIEDPKWGSAEALAQGVYDYTSNYPHVLAGFKGDGVDVVAEIHDWANEKNITIETIDIMKHMNADQATCGSGCSGNPYDAYWAFDPIGHGDIHEMGHSMQKMLFEGFENHAGTNTFSYYTKSIYFANTGEDPDCQDLPFKTIFDTVQSAVGESNVTAFLQTNLWDSVGYKEPYVLKISAMMHAQKAGKLENGWHVLARVHILEREMTRAKEDWEAKKDAVGFSTYTLEEINTIRDNDWLMIAYSYASQLDFRNYFDMMGMPHSAKAYTQIASFGFDEAPNSLFVSTDTGYCQTDEYGTIFDRPTLAIDGNTSYSY